MSNGHINQHTMSATPTIGELKNALERVAMGIVEFDQSSKQWSAFHQSGNYSISGYAWQDYQKFQESHIVSIRGLRGLKQLIAKEIVWLERLANDSGSFDVPCSGSNTIYICTLWQCAMNAALNKQGPIIALDASFTIPPNTSTITTNKKQNKPAKVDIVCESGKKWIRISTLKPIGLLSEFRSAESYMSYDDEDEEELEEEDAVQRGTITQMNEDLSKDELDFVAKQSSIIKIIDDLNSAADHFAKSSSFGKPSIELLLNRLPSNNGTNEIEGKFYDDHEKYRYEARLRAIIKHAQSKGVEIITSDSEQCKKLYSESHANFVIQSSSSSSTTNNDLCQIPKPPQFNTSSSATKILHLDLSALIAFVSHISHMPLPKDAKDAENHFSKTHWRQEGESNSNSTTFDDDNDEGEDEIQPVINEENDVQGQHSRALCEQLCREMTEDCFFDVLIRHLDKGEKLQLTCTREARDKMLEIINLVGGEMEQKRTRCLFDVRTEATDEFWQSSRWLNEGQRERNVRERIQFPVIIMEEKERKIEDPIPYFDHDFTQLAQRSLSTGLHTFNTRQRSSHNAFAALRQTRHTITSMLTGLQNGQTTLTTNISSVKWLVRDMTRLQSFEGNSPGYQTQNNQSNVKSILWVMYPRSLSERMAISSSNTNVIETYSAQPTPSEDDSSKFGLKVKDVLLPHLPIFNNQNNDTSSFMIGSRGRSNRFGRFVKRFLLGPRPRAQLEIKHYRWWPFGSMERAWYRITLPVAWKDPNGEHYGLTYVNNDVERASINEKSIENNNNVNPDPYHDPWWQSIKADLRLNALHWCLLALTLIGWVLGFSFLSKSLWYEGGVVDALGQVTDDTSFYGCTETFWLANSQCGYDGEECSPFGSTTPVDFRCPANCQQTILGQQRAVGDELPAFVPLVVGGSNVSSSVAQNNSIVDSPYIYRADSFVCSAAIHAGVIKANKGGCGRLWVAGAYSGYESVERNGITSTSFNSTFPISYYFDNGVTGKDCEDDRYRGYILNTILLAFIGFVLRPKLIVYFYTLICVAFFHVNFISEPRQYPMSVGAIFGDFLPTLFVGYALWRLNYRFTFPILSKIPIEANIWLQGFYWLGTLLGVVFVKVPLTELVGQDIAERPGALTSLIVLVIVVFCLAINQVRVIRKVGALPKYLTLAVIGAILIGLLAAVPTTALHIHHYIIALVLIPFCAFETRLSLMYSAFLLGMFLNGVGRWSYDGIIQDIAVVRGANIIGSSIPSFLASSNFTGVYPFNSTMVTNVNSTSNLTQLSNEMTGLVNWQPIPANLTDQWNSFQLLIDDVLRVQANQTSYDLGQLASNFIAFNSTTSSSSVAAEIELMSVGANYTIYPDGSDPSNILSILVQQPHYLRLAYYNSISGALGDFTKAATIFFNGTFISPAAGAT